VTDTIREPVELVPPTNLLSEWKTPFSKTVRGYIMLIWYSWIYARNVPTRCFFSLFVRYVHGYTIYVYIYAKRNRLLPLIDFSVQQIIRKIISYLFFPSLYADFHARRSTTARFFWFFLSAGFRGTPHARGCTCIVRWNRSCRRFSFS